MKNIFSLLFLGIMGTGYTMSNMPKLCIEENETGNLRLYHDEAKREPQEWRRRYLPLKESEVEALFDQYQINEYKDIFFYPVVENIDGELSARCEDGDLVLIDKYLNNVKIAFDLFQKFDKDQEFVNLFFSRFRAGMGGWVMDTGTKVNSGKISIDKAHLTHVVYEIDKMWPRQYDSLSEWGPWEIFDTYKRWYLDEGFEESEEYKYIYATVVQALSEGVPIASAEESDKH